MNIYPGSQRCAEIISFNSTKSSTSQCIYRALPGEKHCAKHDPSRQRCPAINSKGQQCRQRWKPDGNIYCHVHQRLQISDRYQGQRIEDYPVLKPTEYDQALADLNNLVLKQKMTASKPPMLGIRSDDEDKKAS